MSETEAAQATGTDAALGEMVTYTDSRGLQKAAVVTGTVASISAAGDATPPDEGNVHLTVFSPTGNTYPRSNVPEGDGPNTFARS